MLKYFLENFLQNSQLKKFLGTRFPGSDTFSTPGRASQVNRTTKNRELSRTVLWSAFINSENCQVYVFILRCLAQTLERPISTQEKFPRTENVLKMSLLKVENFQLQNFFPTENLCRPITFYKAFFLWKIFLSGNGPSYV